MKKKKVKPKKDSEAVESKKKALLSLIEERTALQERFNIITDQINELINSRKDLLKTDNLTMRNLKDLFDISESKPFHTPTSIIDLFNDSRKEQEQIEVDVEKINNKIKMAEIEVLQARLGDIK